MTAITIPTKNDTFATIGPVTLSDETTLVEYDGASGDYVVEGYVDLSAMDTNDITVLTEYFAIDGSNFQIYQQTVFTDAQTQPAIRLHSKLFNLNMLYKATVNQTAGTGRSYPIAFIQQIMSS